MIQLIKEKFKKTIDHYDEKNGFPIVEYEKNQYPVNTSGKTVLLPNSYLFHAMSLFLIIFLLGCKEKTVNKIFDLPIEYKNIELVISNVMPEGGNLVCCADFTTDFNIFKSAEKRLVYSCVSEGKLYERKSPKNIGVFTWYNNRYHFSYNKQDLKNAAKNNGMGFLQWMVIYNYKPSKIKTVKSKNHFRVLAELNGKLHFIEANQKMRMEEFTNELVKMKVKYAIYLDTGKGWETFYYRKNGKKILKHDTNLPFPYRTNYLYFK